MLGSAVRRVGREPNAWAARLTANAVETVGREQQSLDSRGLLGRHFAGLAEMAATGGQRSTQ